MPQFTVYEPNSSNAKTVKKHKKRRFRKRIAL
jgi:hypothetical protein